MHISKDIFYNSRGLWGSVSQWFYLIMPLLTMGLISQEFSRGSIKLLFSAPITGRHIVLGKYLGIMLYWVDHDGYIIGFCRDCRECRGIVWMGNRVHRFY